MRWLFILLVMTSLGCGTSKAEDGHDEHEHDHRDHGHDEHGHDEHGEIHTTVWTDTLELFVAHPHITLGQPVGLHCHLTLLDGFRPFDGEVRFEIVGSDESGTAIRIAPGIFRADVQLARRGNYQIKLRTDVGTVEAPLHTGEWQAHAHHQHQIELLKEQQWNIRFATEDAQRRRLSPTVEVTGELTTPPSGTAHIHAPLGGRIVASRRGLPRPGDEVRRGQLLATLAPTPSSPEAATSADLGVVDAEARVDAARVELDRARLLLEQRAAPERRVVDAERNLRVAEAALGAARRARSLFASAQSGQGGGGWRITSPIDGVVDEVRVSPGEAVDSNELIFRVIDPSTLWVHADVPESWAARFRRGADAAFQLVGADNWRPIRLSNDPNASLVSVSRSVDPQSRTVAVVYELNGPTDDALRVGASLRVAVPIGDPEDAISLPRSAIIDNQGRSMVVVQVEGELFEEHEVRLGARDGDHVAVLSGIEVGQRVVTEGATYVHLAGQANTTIGHGHVH